MRRASSPPIIIGVQRRRPSEHSPGFAKSLILIGHFANAEQRYNDDVVDMKSGFVMQHRPFSQGEGIRGMRFEPGCIAAMMLLLRRTLRGSVRYSTILSLSGILN